MQYIPKRLYLGFKSQGENKPNLSYIGYYGTNGKTIHKKNSIDSWRSKSIPIQELENTPVEGFILNNKVGDGGYSWDKRKAWIRVIDPRGFEVEISVDNLLSILECTSCLPVKKLQGKFVYFFNDGDLILLSCESADYAKLTQHSLKLETKKITSKNVTENRVYITKTGDTMLYLGRFDTYSYGYIYEGKFYKKLEEIEAISNFKKLDIYGSYPWYSSRGINPYVYNKIQRLVPYKEKHYWFAYTSKIFRHPKAFPNNLVEELPDEASSEFDIEKIRSNMLHHPLLHPIVKTEWKSFTLEEFEERLNSGNSTTFFSDSLSFRTDKNSEFVVTEPVYYDLVEAKKKKIPEKEIIEVIRSGFGTSIIDTFDSVEDAYNFIKPMYYVQILDNGTISSRHLYQSNWPYNEHFYEL